MKKILLISTLILTNITASFAVEKMQQPSQQLSLFLQKVVDTHPAFKRFNAIDRKADAMASTMGAYLYNPEISFDKEKLDNGDDTRNFGISQTLDITGKTFAQKRIGKYLAISQKANTVKEKSEYIANLIGAIASYETARKTLKLANEQASLMNRFVKIGESRGKAGDVGSTELSLARLAGAQAQNILADATAELENSKAKLSTLCNCDISLVPELADIPPSLAPPKDIKKLAITLPTYKAVQAADEAAKQNVSFKRRSLILDPTISLGNGSEGDNDLLTFGVSIPIPVLNYGGSVLDEAKAESIQASATLQETKMKLLADLKRMFNIYKGHKKSLISWYKLAKPSLSDYTKSLEQQWNAGELSATNYLLQVKQGIDTAMTGIEIKSHAWLAWANYMALTNQIENWAYQNNSKETK